EAGVIVIDDKSPLAWTGQIVIDPALATQPLAITVTPFYTVLTATAQKGTRRAIASAVIHSESPADRFTKSLDARLDVREDLQGFVFDTSADTSSVESVLNVDGLTLLRADAVPLPRDMARFGRTAKVRGWGTVVLCIGLLILLAVAWRNRNLLVERIVSIAICLGAIALIPWSSFSNASRAFDPTYFYSG